MPTLPGNALAFALFPATPEELAAVVEAVTRDPEAQRGQGTIDYALVLISIVVIVILLTMGNQIQNVFSKVAVLQVRDSGPSCGTARCLLTDD